MVSGNYDEALNWLYDLQYFGVKLGLANTRALLAELGNPQEKFRAVHVAGTNGKGSVCAYLTSILAEAGLKVGTYTSPHLRDFGERIAVNGIPMSRSETLAAIRGIRPMVDGLAARGVQCTFFETTTAMAFRHFARRKVDIAVVEVGMGGRLDATNVLQPDMGIITSISLEHTQHLGTDTESIAREKAGIIKAGMDIVSAVDEPGPARVIEDRCRKVGARLHRPGDIVQVDIGGMDMLGSNLVLDIGGMGRVEARVNMPGAHQAKNAATAAAAASVLASGGLPVDAGAVKRGLENARWPARLQVLRTRPVVILDTTHNPGGAGTLAAFLERMDIRPVLVLGMLADKDIAGVVGHLEPLASSVIVTQPSYHRRLPADELAGYFSGDAEVVGDVAAALERAMKLAGQKRVVLVTGSIFTASDALAYLERLNLGEALDILAGHYGVGAYPGRDPGRAGPPPPGSQEPFRVLVSTILSQRTRDENTHQATEALFSRYSTPGEIAALEPGDIMDLIRPAGFYRQKAAKIIDTARALVNMHGSRVPDTMEELLSLPGVGRKTAACVLSYGFGKPAIAVDTHVHRIGNLMGLVRTDEPWKTEEALASIAPTEMWSDINRLLVRHGQGICRPQGPRCGECPISHLCQHGIYRRRDGQRG